eukprot:TRINITY_DN16063_c0_g1_i1.p2 TRINITY_DN16063_c0_g1~~TRINITY_DN16063_c0_g1_i1.p2  ORF type:complete len:156 (-),score=14.17 TRINITY_DN16063_c0_g1_i1:37-504(-)
MIKIKNKINQQISKYSSYVEIRNQQYPRRFEYWGKMKVLQSVFGWATLILFTFNAIFVFLPLFNADLHKNSMNFPIQNVIVAQITITLFCLMPFLISVLGIFVIKFSAAILAFFAPEVLLSVSYTHLTLPTKRIVQFSVVAGSSRKENTKRVMLD